jgi:protein required for attachment to host cells
LILLKYTGGAGHYPVWIEADLDGPAMKKQRTLFIIADGGHVRFVEKRIGEMVFDTVKEFDSPVVHEPARHLGSDRPGRSRESIGLARHAVQPRHDLHTAGKIDFLRGIGGELNAARRRGEFDHLVLVAPAKALGHLLEALDDATEASVTARLRKDLTRVPDGQLPGHLSDIVHGWRAQRPVGAASS